MTQTTLPATRRTGLLRGALIVAGGTLLLALSARVQVPMWPVPMSLQSLAVLMLGLTLGARLASATVAAYLLQGAMGLPVFASGAGLAYLAGPTGGFLLGFLAMAAVTGGLADRGWSRRLVPALLAGLAGSAALYLLGAGWLALTLGAERALAVGVLPFLPGDALKVILAALAVSGLGAAANRS